MHFFISLRHGYFSVACNAVNAKLAAHSKAPFSFAVSICQQAFPAYLMQDILKLNIYFCKACISFILYIPFIYPDTDISIVATLNKLLKTKWFFCILNKIIIYCVYINVTENGVLCPFEKSDFLGH